MGTLTPQDSNKATRQEAARAEVVKKERKPFKLTIVSKEELERRRIPVYSYIL